METLNLRKLGLAMGLTGALLYIGCMLIMLVAGREGTIFIFNSFMHGLDTETIIRMDIPLIDSVLGLVATFVLGWMSGALIAFFYNISIPKKTQ